MKYERFTEEFSNLYIDEKVAIYNAYCQEVCSEDEIWDFDEDFFERMFSNPMESARATFFGNIQSWNDPYIKFNGYGNLESLSEYDAEQEIDDYLQEIFAHEDVWEDYIDNEDDEEEEEDDEEEEAYNR